MSSPRRGVSVERSPLGRFGRLPGAGVLRALPGARRGARRRAAPGKASRSRLWEMICRQLRSRGTGRLGEVLSANGERKLERVPTPASFAAELRPGVPRARGACSRRSVARPTKNPASAVLRAISVDWAHRSPVRPISSTASGSPVRGGATSPPNTAVGAPATSRTGCRPRSRVGLAPHRPLRGPRQLLLHVADSTATRHAGGRRAAAQPGCTRVARPRTRCDFAGVVRGHGGLPHYPSRPRMSSAVRPRANRSPSSITPWNSWAFRSARARTFSSIVLVEMRR